MVVRFYSSTAAETILSGTINNAATTINVDSVAGLPISYPYTLALDYESASEELVDVTAAAGTSLTITRAVDGTSATGHSAGARVRHVSSARDFRDSRNHENAVAGVHGVAGNVVGTTDTQTLSNKTLVQATGSLNKVEVFSENSPGTWTTTVHGDIDNTADLFQWKRASTEPHEVAKISNDGALFIRNQNAGADAVNATYRVRVVKDNGTTNIFQVLQGGNVKTFPATGEPGFMVKPTDETDNKAFSVRDPSDTNDRFVVWGNGRVDINQVDGSLPAFDITAAAVTTNSIMRVMDNASNGLLDVSGTGLTTMRRLGAARNEGANAADVVFTVNGRTAGQTGDLTRWTGTTSTPVARVNFQGQGRFTGLRHEVTGINYLPVQVGTATTTFTSDQDRSVNVTFPTAFPGTPNVTISKSNAPGGSDSIVVSAINATATGFTAFFNTVDNVAVSATGLTASWQAVSPP